MPQVATDLGVVDYDRDPDKCPLCHHSIQPEQISSFLTGSIIEPGTYLERVYRCPRHECRRAFIGRFRASGPGSHMFVFKESVPEKFVTPEIKDEILKISPVFVKVFRQAAEAESRNLDEIAGVGYRKALEFLVKDYCVSQHPDKDAEIKSAQLAKVIKDYVSEEPIKQCASRASWLGNDETHYVRKWENKDINDLKILIRLTTNWIESSLLTAKYLLDMNQGK